MEFSKSVPCTIICWVSLWRIIGPPKTWSSANTRFTSRPVFGTAVRKSRVASNIGCAKSVAVGIAFVRLSVALAMVSASNLWPNWVG